MRTDGPTPPSQHVTYLLRLADNAVVLGHRLSEWSGRAPTLEEDIALSNIGLDLLGQARALYAHAAAVENAGRSEDALAFLRDATAYLNVQLVELPNRDFAASMARQLAYSVFAELQWRALSHSADAELAGIAAKAEKECTYHVRHSAEWMIRLGDGTDESHARAQGALDALWMYVGELFECDAVDRAMITAGIGIDAGNLRAEWSAAMDAILREATLRRPADAWMASGGRTGVHTEHLGHLLAQMQILQRSHPGATW